MFKIFLFYLFLYCFMCIVSDNKAFIARLKAKGKDDILKFIEEYTVPKNAAIFLILLALLVNIVGCAPTPSVKKQTKDTLYLMLDYTEGQQYNIDFTKLIQQEGMYNRVVIEPIVDMSYTSTTEIDLTFSDESHGNEFIQKTKTKNFFKEKSTQFNDIITGYNTSYNKELPKSSILNPLCDIYEIATDKDKVVILSDLIENSAKYNFRKLSQAAITGALTESCEPTCTTTVYLSTERKVDDEYMRTSATAFKDYFKIHKEKLFIKTNKLN